MKAYLINLDGRPDRREHFLRQADARGIKIERVSAVDGQRPEIVEATETRKPAFTNDSIGPYAYACFESHRSVWRRLLKSGDEHAIVLEDDVLLSEDFARFQSSDWVPGEADIVKMETFRTRIHLDRIPVLTVAGRQVRRLRSKHLGTGCYAIARRAAEWLLRETEGFGDPIDQSLFSPASPLFEKLTIFQMTPAPAVQGVRVDTSGTGSGWSASSLMTDRLQRAVLPGSSTPGGRILNRLRNEIRALRAGTSYVVVPYE